MKIKIACPTDFICETSFNSLLKKYGFEPVWTDPECVIVNPGTDEFLGPKYFSQFKSLKIVGTPSTGVNHIDIEYLAQNDIPVMHLLDDRATLDNIHASAEFTWLHIMNATRKFSLAVQNKEKWREKSNEGLLRSNELHGKKIGIIGMGRIGKKLAKYATAFGMEIYWYDPYVDHVSFKSQRVKSLNKLKVCDIISINCYLTDETMGLITYDVFDGFKENLIVVNTSRGEVVNENYIYDLVVDNKIVYSTDVLCDEQDIKTLYKSDLFNLKHDNLTITPHVAGATLESQTKAFEAILRLCKYA